MHIEDEATPAQLFARRRLIFQCQATPLTRHNLEWNQVMAQYRDRFGPMAELARISP